MEVSMSITRRGKYTDSNICMNVQVCDVACLFFLLYANLLVLVTLCEGNHYPFIEERYIFLRRYAIPKNYEIRHPQLWEFMDVLYLLLCEPNLLP